MQATTHHRPPSPGAEAVSRSGTSPRGDERGLEERVGSIARAARAAQASRSAGVRLGEAHIALALAATLNRMKSAVDILR